MKNREWLNSMAAIDILTNAQYSIMHIGASCIIEALEGHHCECPTASEKDGCAGCIAAWLNEERR